MSENYFASKYSSICWSLVKKLMCISNNIQRQNYKWTFKIKSLFFSPKVQKCGSNEMVLHLFYWYCFKYSIFLLMPLWHMDGTCDATMMVLENPDVTKCIVNDQEFLHGKPIQIFLIWPIRTFVNYVFFRRIVWLLISRRKIY